MASVVGSKPASMSIVGNRLGLNEVLWKTSSVANAGATMSSSTNGATFPRCVNRSPVNSVLVVSSIHSPLSHPCGTCGVEMNRRRCVPNSSGSCPATCGGRSARSFSETMHAVGPWMTSGVGSVGEEEVHGPAFVGLDVTEGDPSQGLRIDDLRHGIADQRVQLTHAGVEQERLLVADQELVERQTAGPDLGDVCREAEDVGGDFVNGCEHGGSFSVSRPAMRRTR